jgi:hypothetical protein
MNTRQWYPYTSGIIIETAGSTETITAGENMQIELLSINGVATPNLLDTLLQFQINLNGYPVYGIQADIGTFQQVVYVGPVIAIMNPGDTLEIDNTLSTANIGLVLAGQWRWAPTPP